MATNTKSHDYYVRVRLTKEAFDRLVCMANNQRRSKSEVVRIALDNMYEKKES